MLLTAWYQVYVINCMLSTAWYQVNVVNCVVSSERYSVDAIILPDCLITSGAIHGTDPLIAFKLSSNDAVHSPDGKL